jgi:hypothetical protein
MDSDETKSCQITVLPQISQGYAPVPPESFLRKLRLFARRSLNARQVRLFKTKTDHILKLLKSKVFRRSEAASAEAVITTNKFNPGDTVRVKSREEIQLTLNTWGQLKGCMFMPNEMSKYCGTTQRVFKNLERFLDERDYHVKKAHGIVLLEGTYCQGTTDYGRCDRSCFFFWREEWLEKIEDGG